MPYGELLTMISTLRAHANKIAKHQELAICLQPDQKECCGYGVCKHTGDVNAVGEGGVQHARRSTIISMMVSTMVDSQEYRQS